MKGSVVFVVSIFVGMFISSLVLNILNPDLAASNFSSAAFFGWFSGFTSLYYYLKIEWLKYPAFVAFASFMISLMN